MAASCPSEAACLPAHLPACLQTSASERGHPTPSLAPRRCSPSPPAPSPPALSPQAPSLPAPSLRCAAHRRGPAHHHRPACCAMRALRQPCAPPSPPVTLITRMRPLAAPASTAVRREAGLPPGVSGRLAAFCVEPAGCTRRQRLTELTCPFPAPPPPHICPTQPPTNMPTHQHNHPPYPHRAGTCDAPLRFNNARQACDQPTTFTCA